MKEHDSVGTVEEQFTAVERTIGFEFRNNTLLKLALKIQHRKRRTTVNIRSTQLENSSFNQRSINNAGLCQMGDALLTVFTLEPQMPSIPVEFDALNRKKSNRKLASIFDKLGLIKFLDLNLQDKHKLGEHRKADVVEALLGAIYLDQGIETARSFYLQHLHS